MVFGAADHDGCSFHSGTQRKRRAISAVPVKDLSRLGFVKVHSASASRIYECVQDTVTKHTTLSGTKQSKQLGVRRYDRIDSRELDSILGSYLLNRFVLCRPLASSYLQVQITNSEVSPLSHTVERHQTSQATDKQSRRKISEKPRLSDRFNPFH